MSPEPPADPPPDRVPGVEVDPEPDERSRPDLEPDAEPDPTRVTDGLAAAWSLDEMGGGVAHDVSGTSPPLVLAVDFGPGAAWEPGSYHASSPARLQSPQPAGALIAAVRESDAFTLEAWMTPDGTEQTGPARILSISSSPTARNVTLAQEGTQLRLRLRTTSTGDNGLPEVSTGDGVLTGELAHVSLTRDPAGAVHIYVNGAVVLSDSIGGALDGWDDMPMILANEATGDRPWLGALHLAAVYARALSPAEVQANFAAGPDAELPLATPDPAPEPDGPEPGAGCITGSDPLGYTVTPQDPSRTFALPLEDGAVYSRLEVQYTFQPADWGGSCYNPVYSSPKSVPQFHSLLSIQRGMHWCKGGSILDISARGPGKNQLVVKTHWQDPPHSGSGCGQSQEFEPMPTIKKALDPNTKHTIEVVYDTAANLVEVTVDGQLYSGAPLAAAWIKPVASHPIALRLSLPEWLECYDANGAHTDAAACCWIPSVGWTFEDLTYTVCP